MLAYFIFFRYDIHREGRKFEKIIDEKKNVNLQK
jgi:hypothetical protein